MHTFSFNDYNSFTFKVVYLKRFLCFYCYYFVAAAQPDELVAPPSLVCLLLHSVWWSIKAPGAEIDIDLSFLFFWA